MLWENVTNVFANADLKNKTWHEMPLSSQVPDPSLEIGIGLNKAAQSLYSQNHEVWDGEAAVSHQMS